jgi:hypothetical protein
MNVKGLLMNKFKKFLKSLKTEDNSSLVEAISKGYSTVMLESWEAIDVSYGGGQGTVEVDFQIMSDFNIGEYIDVDDEKWKSLLLSMLSSYEITDLESDDLYFGFSGTAIIDGNFSGGWHSASSTGPAEGPEWEPSSPVFDDVMFQLLDEDGTVYEELEISEDTKELLSILEDNFYSVVDEDAIDEQAYEDVSAPRGHRSHYNGPM